MEHFEAFPPILIAFIFLILPMLDWTATYILHKAANTRSNIAVEERAKMAAVLAVATSINALLALNRIFEAHVDQIIIVIVLSISLTLISVPNIYWLFLYFGNKLRK